MGETGKFFFKFVNFSGPDKFIREEDTIYIYDDDKMSPDVDQSCVFPSEDGFGQHHSCRRIVDWEETGIEDSKYRVNMQILKLKK